MTEQHAQPETPHTLGEIVVWLRIGLLSIGGPAAHIALIESEIVERLKWADRDTFLRGLSFATMLPGPEAQQLATYLGWHHNGLRGGVIAGLGFVLPGAALMIALTLTLSIFGGSELLKTVFAAVQPVIVAFVALAIWRLRAQALLSPGHFAAAILTFLTIWLTNVPFLIILVTIVAVALCVPQLFGSAYAPGAREARQPAPNSNRTRRAFMLGTGGILAWCLVYVTSAAFLGATFQTASGLISASVLVVFGGAYAAVGYIAEQGVQVLNLITAHQVADGLALSEAAPGPLILFNTYVGTLVSASEGASLLRGIAGGIIATFFTFLPSFVFVLAGAPFVAELSRYARINVALSAVASAVIGLIANLCVLIALPAFWRGGGFDLENMAIAALAFVAVLLARVPAPIAIFAAALYGVLRWTFSSP